LRSLSHHQENNFNPNKSARQKNQYRYGNSLLGKRDGGLPEDDEICGCGYFTEVWASDPEARKCVVRKWLPFAKCDECTQHRESTAKTHDFAVRAELAESLSKHLLFVNRERMSYCMRRMQGVYQPSDFLSMIVDGADQSDHDLPHQPFKSHAADAAYRLKLHLMGVIVHGVGSFAYTCPANFAQGNNVTIQVLCNSCDAGHRSQRTQHHFTGYLGHVGPPGSQRTQTSTSLKPSVGQHNQVLQGKISVFVVRLVSPCWDLQEGHRVFSSRWPHS
jgi:hypothetical protein